MAVGSIGPDAMSMMRLKKYGDMQKKLNKRATLRAANYDLSACGIQGDILSQSLVKDSNDNKMDNNSEHHFPAVLVSAVFCSINITFLQRSLQIFNIKCIICLVQVENATVIAV